MEDQSMKKWGVGLFAGKNNHNRSVIFGISLINQETKEDFKKLFIAFFQTMKKCPETIITDQQIAIIGALKSLKEEGSWDGAHLLDSFHILKNIKKKTKNK